MKYKIYFLDTRSSPDNIVHEGLISNLLKFTFQASSECGFGRHVPNPDTLSGQDFWDPSTSTFFHQRGNQQENSHGFECWDEDVKTGSQRRDTCGRSVGLINLSKQYNGKIFYSHLTRFLVLDSPGAVEEDDDVVFNGGDPKVSPDPDFVINMKLRQQVRYKTLHFSKAAFLGQF